MSLIQLFECCTELPPVQVHDLVGRIKNSDKPTLMTARHSSSIEELGVPAYDWGGELNTRRSSIVWHKLRYQLPFAGSNRGLLQHDAGTCCAMAWPWHRVVFNGCVHVRCAIYLVLFFELLSWMDK